MSLISQLLPEPSLKQVDRVAVAAAPSRAWAIARGFDLYQLPFARWLFRLRAGLQGIPPRARIEDLPPGPGFLVLGEEPGREVVVGAVGRFWQPSIDFVELRPDRFRAFDEPGFGKVAWCIRADPRDGGGTWLTVEVRVAATDPVAWRRFSRYWRLIGPFSHAIRHGALRWMTDALGAAPPDDARPLAGDGLLPDARAQFTHAVTIDAPPAQVWPWLMQMGAGRAGWYSWDLLDNGGVRSADRIIPALQHLKLGDLIPALPDDPSGFAVLTLAPRRSLVIGDPSLAPGGTRSPDAPPWKTTWAFVLEPIGDDATHLVVRVRAAYTPGLAMAIVRPVVGLVHEAMERRQLHNLRLRAERRV